MSPRPRRPGRTVRRLAVGVTDARGHAIAAGGLGPWLVRMGPRVARGHVAIALVPDAVIRRLNRTYRGVDRPTDVLSFPARARAARSQGQPRCLGDIAIAVGVARRQARRFGHPLAVELRLLALHGLLHLLGYDHETDRGDMSRFEERLRRRAGLPAGVVARAARDGRTARR